MPNQQDAFVEITNPTDRPAEGIGEVDEARFKAVPAEVRANTDAALSRAFPEPEKHATGKN